MPAAFHQRLRSYFKASFAGPEFSVCAVLSVPVKDLAGDIVRPEGLDFSRHAADPWVDLEHGLDRAAKSLPVGWARDTLDRPGGAYSQTWAQLDVTGDDGKVRKHRLPVGTTYFDRDDALQRQTYHLVRAGALPGVSIEFVPVKGHLKALGRSPLEPRAAYEFGRAEVVRWTHCAEPVCPDARVVLKSVPPELEPLVKALRDGRIEGEPLHGHILKSLGRYRPTAVSAAVPAATPEDFCKALPRPRPRQKSGTFTPEQHTLLDAALRDDDRAGWGALGDHLAERGHEGAGAVLSNYATGHPDTFLARGDSEVAHEMAAAVRPGAFRYHYTPSARRTYHSVAGRHADGTPFYLQHEGHAAEGKAVPLSAAADATGGAAVRPAAAPACPECGGAARRVKGGMARCAGCRQVFDPETVTSKAMPTSAYDDEDEGGGPLAGRPRADDEDEDDPADDVTDEPTEYDPDMPPDAMPQDDEAPANNGVTAMYAHAQALEDACGQLEADMRHTDNPELIKLSRALCEQARALAAEAKGHGDTMDAKLQAMRAGKDTDDMGDEPEADAEGQTDAGGEGEPVAPADPMEKDRTGALKAVRPAYRAVLKAIRREGRRYRLSEVLKGIEDAKAAARPKSVEAELADLRAADPAAYARLAERVAYLDEIAGD
jgi:hypothetical protein